MKTSSAKREKMIQNNPLIRGLMGNPDLLKQEKAKRGMMNFTKYTMPDYYINWHHKNLADALDKLERREIKRLMVFMPPRNGKSELVSRRFPAYILGRNPDANVIATSYSDTLAKAMNRDVQRIIDSEEYQTLFPETYLQGIRKDQGSYGNYIRNSETFEIVGKRGKYISAGIGGGITGKGADFAIIDDPVKNRKDAESQVYRDDAEDWFSSTLYTRLEKDACILVTMTRWHEDDLAGRLLEKAANDPEADQWHVINYPALYDQDAPHLDETDPRKHGEALWPAKYDEKQLHVIKSTIGTYQWSALYQQNPSPPGGSIIHRGWIQYYKKLPYRIDRMVLSWDMTFKDNKDTDFVVGQAWAEKGADKYLVDEIRGQFSFTETLRAVKSFKNKHHRANAILIEDKANGPAIIDTLKHEISGIIPVEPDGSKTERLEAVAPQFEAGNIYVPEEAEFTHDFVEELVSFPTAKHDDRVDTSSQALNFFRKRKPATVSSRNIW